MHHNLHNNWSQILTERGDSLALIDAESGKTWSFREVGALADEWLAWHPTMGETPSQVWCLALSDRVMWLSVFLAAIRKGAILLPIEPGLLDTLLQQAVAQGAHYLIHDEGVRVLSNGRPRTGFFLIKLTSGTTGSAQALPFTESEMLADGRQIMSSMSISAQDRNYAIIPLGHSYGLGNLVMPFFMLGVPMVLASSPFPQVMLEELQQFPCSILALVPPLIKALARITIENAALSRVRLVISAGSALDAKVAEHFRVNTGQGVCNFYGSSETGGICFDRTGSLAELGAGVGPVMDGVRLLIDKTQSIQVKSDAICHAVYPSGYCQLHDYGQFDESGVLHLLGRHADIVKIAGRRVSLLEIESALCSAAKVTDAYVSSRIGRSGEVYCVAVYSGRAEIKDVRRELESTLALWKLPKVLRKVVSIPYTSRGKKDRKAIEALI